jgi:hypothetical protein
MLRNVVEFEVLTAVQTTLTLCSPVEVYRSFRGPYCFHLQGWGVSEIRNHMLATCFLLVTFLAFSSTLKMKSGGFLPDYTALHPRKHNYSYLTFLLLLYIVRLHLRREIWRCWSPSIIQFTFWNTRFFPKFLIFALFKILRMKWGFINIFYRTISNSVARGSVVGWGTLLQARRSRIRFPMRSLEFFSIYLLLPTAL